MGNLIPFDLENFKAGQKALTRNGRIATFIGVCNECRASNRLVAHIHGYDSVFTYFASGVYPDEDNRYSLYDLVSMVSRHQALIDSYDPEDTWQWSRIGENDWAVAATPSWYETLDYRLHPHNDLIKAHKSGAKIELSRNGVKWEDADEPAWNKEWHYRIKPEYTYPIYKKSKESGLVVKFTDVCNGEVVIKGNSIWDVGHFSDIFVEHTDKQVWEDWIPPKGWVDPEEITPTTKTVYEWIHEANVGNVNYFVSLWVADEDVEHFFGLDTPKQKYKTGRSWETEV